MMDEQQAKAKGYTKLIFSEYDTEANVKDTHTYQDFLRDKIDFVIVENGNKINLMRQRDYNTRQGGLH